MAYRTTGVGSRNVTRSSQRVKELSKDFGGLDADEVQILNGLIALGYDPALVRRLADQDPGRRYLGDAIARALREGVDEGDIRKALAYNKAAVETKDPVLRVQDLAKALGIDIGQVSRRAREMAGMQGRRDPTPDQWVQAATEVGGFTAEGASNFTRYARFEHADFVGKDVVRDQAPPPGGDREGFRPTGGPRPGGDAIGAVPPAVAAARGIGGPGTGAPGAGAGARPGAGAGAGAKTPGTVTAVVPGADKPTDPFPTDPSKVRDWLTRNNPEWAYLLDIPEVAAIVRNPEVWKEGADDQDLLARLMQTQWWQKTEPAARQWLDLKHRDNASALDQIANKKTTLKQTAQALGVTIPEDQWDRIAEDSLKFAWDENEVRANLTNYFVFDQDRLTGAAQAARAHIEQAARDWLVPMDDKTMEDWVTQIVKGTATTDYFDTYLANQARSLFPQLTDAIDRGVAPAQYMAPYASIAAQELSLNPEDIDLRDPKWMRAVHQVDDKGGRRPMTLYDWRNLVRTDESYGWDKTQAGRDHGASLARNIAAQFGFSSGGGL